MPLVTRMVTDAVERCVCLQPIKDDDRISRRQTTVTVSYHKSIDVHVFRHKEAPQHRCQTRNCYVHVPYLGAQLCDLPEDFLWCLSIFNGPVWKRFFAVEPEAPSRKDDW